MVHGQTNIKLRLEVYMKRNNEAPSPIIFAVEKQ